MDIVTTLMALVKLGIDVAPFVAKLAATFKKDAPPPTADALDALRALEAEMSDQIQAPLPPERP